MLPVAIMPVYQKKRIHYIENQKDTAYTLLDRKKQLNMHSVQIHAKYGSTLSILVVDVAL
jgi:hypothetical protein